MTAQVLSVSIGENGAEKRSYEPDLFLIKYQGSFLSGLCNRLEAPEDNEGRDDLDSRLNTEENERPRR